MGAKLGGEGAMSEINMTPLIDIVLVVLIIMMVNIPIQIEEMGVKLPGQKTTNTPPPSNSEQLVIGIYEDGRIALNRRAMDEATLRYQISARLRSKEKKNVFIDAHASVPYKNVVDMVDLAREAGAEQVGLSRMKEDGPQSITGVEKGGMPRGVYIGNPVVAGAITTKKADRAIQRLKGKITACYSQRLGARPDLTGSMRAYVEVGPQGELLNEPEIQSNTTQDLDLKDCVEALLPELQYEALGEQKTAAIYYPLLFSPG